MRRSKSSRPQERRAHPRRAGDPVRKRFWRRRRGIHSPLDVPAVSADPGGGRELSWARFAIFFTLAAWVAYTVHQAMRLLDSPRVTVWQILETATYMGIVALLTMSALAYLIARLGHLWRARDHQPTARVHIDEFFHTNPTPGLTVIVPSYREDERVVRQTLLSAALQEYAGLRVVLLIDDPPAPADPAHRRALAQARALPKAIERVLRRPHACHLAEATAFDARVADGHHADGDDLERLAERYRKAARYLRRYAGYLNVVDHQDQFLRHAVLFRLVDDFEATGAALRAAATDGALISTARVAQLHWRLARVFDATVTSFERKTYASLSHEANKAMNLNSYLSVMGRSFNVRRTPQGNVLIDTAAASADVTVPDTDYVLTLDADSMVLPEYCLRLVHLMEQPEHARTAVMQTPYSAYPGARARVERIAGATTDVQRLVHQGLTRYGASFWVGANAILRKSALDDIAERSVQDGFAVTRYIQDRTVVEDTESSIDIAHHGWDIHNYPGRLSYSATPPDFGSLCVQRQRWANGGLVILPKLFGLHRTGGRVHHAIGWFLRANYLASIAWSSLGLLFLLAYPYNTALFSPFAVLTALPYFVAMSTDLKRTGYRRLDVARVYGFNLLLLPVNLAGVLQSLGQAIGGHKIAFRRTPKIRNRTVAPLSFVLLPYLLLVYSAYTLYGDVQHSRYLHAAFAGVNAVMAGYAVVAFVGLRHSLVDVVLSLREMMYTAPRRAKTAPDTAPAWEAVLYHGVADPHTTPSAAQATTLALVDQARSDAAPPGALAATAAAGPVTAAEQPSVSARRPPSAAEQPAALPAEEVEAPSPPFDGRVDIRHEVARLIDACLASGDGTVDVWAGTDGVHLRLAPAAHDEGSSDVPVNSHATVHRAAGDATPWPGRPVTNGVSG